MDIYKKIFPNPPISHSVYETQCRRVLRLLLDSKRTQLPQLLNMTPKVASHTARISDLRRRMIPLGYNIVCHMWWVDTDQGKERHSEYEVVKLKK